MSRTIAIRRYAADESPMMTALDAARRAGLIESAHDPIVLALRAAAEAGDDLELAAKGIIIGVVRGARQVGVAHLHAIGRTSELVIRTTARLSGDVGAATKGLIEGAIHGAREIGFDVVDAATAAAAGAMMAAARVGAETGLRVRGALVRTIANLKGALNDPLGTTGASKREPA